MVGALGREGCRVEVAVDRSGYKACMYPVLFSRLYLVGAHTSLLDLDLNPYLSRGHPEPHSLLMRRPRKDYRLKATRMTDICTIQKFIVQNNVRTTEELLDYAERDPVLRSFGENPDVNVQQLINKSHEAADSLSHNIVDGKGPLDKVKDCLSVKCACSCPGMWAEKVSALVEKNLRGKGARRFKADIVKTLNVKRSHQTHIVLYGPPSSGKSSLFRPLAKILKCAIANSNSEFSEDFRDCECILWNNFWPGCIGDGRDMAIFTSLLKGDVHRVGQLMSHGQEGGACGELVPIFITCNEHPAPRRAEDDEGLLMGIRRSYFFPHQIDSSEMVIGIEPCARCCADWLFTK